MATIAKVTTGASASSALNYALGQDKAMHNDTERWLEEHQLERPDDLKNCRAVAVGGTNGIDPMIAKEQFKAVQQAFNQTQRQNQVRRITQSFADNELNARNPSDWQRANDLGCQLAQQLYPDYQSAVYTHIDGKNHIIHNHIIVSKVNLETGKKMQDTQGHSVDSIRNVNDEIAKEQGWQVIAPVREHQSQAEHDLTKKGEYSYMHDLRSRIDTVMQDTSICDFKTFSAALAKSGVNVSIRGQNVSYAFLDANNKQRRARGKRLGTDYDKETILHELERRTRERTAQQLDREDQGRANELVRDTKQADTETTRTDTALEQRERQAQSRKPRIDQLRNAVKPIADHLQHFT
ncbi:relaxase/mobilization nuclease domain-containing protein, partial [Lentilactobacillus buchneri]